MDWRGDMLGRKLNRWYFKTPACELGHPAGSWRSCPQSLLITGLKTECPPCSTPKPLLVPLETGEPSRKFQHIGYCILQFGRFCSHSLTEWAGPGPSCSWFWPWWGWAPIAGPCRGDGGRETPAQARRRPLAVMAGTGLAPAPLAELFLPNSKPPPQKASWSRR